MPISIVYLILYMIALCVFTRQERFIMVLTYHRTS
jgi:hypothetical protein